MTHDVRTRCPRCGAWFWAGDAHTCPPSAVLAVAFPDHGRMVTAHADGMAARAAEAYRARIAEENAYYAGLFGLVLTGRAA